MKKSYLLTCIWLVMSLLGFIPITHAQTYPYFCGFEDDTENAQWTLVNGDLTNQWCIGTADKHEGEKGLYISNDGGTSSGYSPNSPATTFAYRTFEITEEGAYSISFDYNVLGEGSDWGVYDYADALLAPASAEFTASSEAYQIFIPDGCISLTDDSYLIGQYEWKSKTSLQQLTAGTYKLVFMWHNDDMTGEGSAAIDNVRIEKLSSSPSIAVSSSLEFPLTATGTSSIATLTIRNTGGGDLYISSFNFSNPAFEMVAPPSYPDTIESLGGEKSYQIKFTPSSASEISGTLTIQNNDEEKTITLTGSGYSAIEITDDAPIFEDFNNLDSSKPNMGLGSWTLKNGYATGSTATSWSICTTSAYVCDGKSLQANDARATSTALLISPKLTFAADRSAKISFYMRRAGGTSKENEGFKVYVNTVGEIYSYDSDGNVVSQHDATPVRQVISEETSSTVREILEYVVSDGTGKNGQVAGYRIGGKTGTADKRGTRDPITNPQGDVVVSFLCFAPADDPQVIMLLTMDTPSRTTGTYVSGGNMVAPTASSIMSNILPHLGIAPQYTEDEIGSADATVPYVVGMTEEEAAAKLSSYGFSNYRTVGDGDTVTDQTPLGGAIVPADAEIILYMGAKKSTDLCTVPNVVGMSASNANKALTNAGLIIKTTGASGSGARVISQSVEEGAQVAAGTVVTVQMGQTGNTAD